MSNNLDSDHSVYPDLGPNCLHLVISRHQKWPIVMKELKRVGCMKQL